ncbi:uncharacterized protein Dyak_GE27954 [Drosophila yakuba]|uniref:Uncharacterized protein n=1 Tax=Drosophila yakuba TaxID=7245 RepID=A0A0R1EG66_DROYA|nr:uncharacterized protein Dyak_GE27954 [Drosophila yakuba]
MAAIRKKISRMALAVTCYYFIHFSYKYAHATTASGASRTLSGFGNVNHRLPRTSASYFSSGASANTNFKTATKSKNLTRYGNIHIRKWVLSRKQRVGTTTAGTERHRQNSRSSSGYNNV